MIRYLRLLLFPVSLIYGFVIIVRNLLFDWKILKSEKFDIPVICAGNLVVGGSGKTPVTEYLVRLLPAYKIAILSRGYGRKTTGFIIADHNATAATIGDEPMQYYNKFTGVTVAVCEDRVTGIRQLQADHDLIILDDAFQHRKVVPGFSILLFEYRSLFSTQFLLPSGNLREPFGGYKRADLLLITKAPAKLLPAQAELCTNHFNSNKPVFFSSIEYGALKSLNRGELLELNTQTHITLLTGIANPVPLVEFLETKAKINRHYNFPDHYQFKEADIKRVISDFEAVSSANKIIVTTEKDAQRLLTGALNKLLVNLPVYILPIQIKIHDEGKAAFDKQIKNYVANAKRNR